MNCGAMLNAYPDSLGGRLGDIAALLERPELKDCFQSLYVLPSLYHTDLDRGFSVQDYDLEASLASEEELRRIREAGIDLKLDFILNHASVLSPMFRDLTEKGDASEYRDFFIDWNCFWDGCGRMTPEGYIQPDDAYIGHMFFRKPGLPILMVRFPDGSSRPYWNTFYQQVWEEDGETKYLGQMDLNVRCDKVWAFYRETLGKLASYGASIVRLDAFAYAPKTPGKRNFLNEPDTWKLLERVNALASANGLTCLPEIHASYGEGLYRTLAAKGYMTYDFFLPGLIIDALDRGCGDVLKRWADEQVTGGIRTVNMLGCHDGIPVLDLKGLLPDERIQALIDLIVSRGGLVKNLHGKKNMYYQVNATYYSALGANDRRMLMARALQLFMPGKPQVWYLDLFAGENDLEAVRAGGEAAHKEINRTNLSPETVEERLRRDVVRDQLTLLRLRSTCPAFGFDSAMAFDAEDTAVRIVWTKDDARAELTADLASLTFTVRCASAGKTESFSR